MKRAWLVAGGLLALYLLLGWVLGRGAGLTRSITIDNGREALAVDRVAAIDLEGVSADVLGRPGVQVTWRGAWRVPSAGLYDLSLDAAGYASWSIDGHLAQYAPAPGHAGSRRTVWLDAGFHAIELTLLPDPASPRLAVLAAGAGEPPAALSQAALKPRLPRNPAVRAATDVARRALFWILCGAIVLAVRRTLAAWPAAPLPDRSVWIRPLVWVALAVVMTWGALLRIDAMTARFGVATAPAWLVTLQTRDVAAPESIRPASWRWDAAPMFPHPDGPPTKYISDPYTYLQAARAMTSFYQAHWREPVYPAAIRIALAALDDQDIAVSVTSTSFGVLAIWLIYLLGAGIWSRPVGLAAALGYAIDFDAVTLASQGWRDDAYVAAVAATMILLLQCWRLAGSPRETAGRARRGFDRAWILAAVLGAAAGLSVLVRIMAASFVGAGAAWFLLAARAPWSRRAALVGTGALTAVLVAGPYFVNCWRVYGDPLYTFNVHGDVYRVAEGGSATQQGTLSYILGKAAARPWDFAETLATGMTSYPFNNKGGGLQAWWSPIRDWTRVAALVGLFALALTAHGRFMLVVVAGALLPFAFTWKVDSNWRFTAHVYPMFLIAAGVGVSVTWALVRRVVGGPRVCGAASGEWQKAPWPAWVGVSSAALLGAWLIGSVMPARAFSETLAAGDDATIAAASGGWVFLGRGWSRVLGEYPVQVRVARTDAVLYVPLPAVADYPITLRVDPFPRPLDSAMSLPIVAVRLNDAPVTTAKLSWSPDRVGAVRVVLPRAHVRRGSNTLELRLIPADGAPPGRRDAGLSEGSALALWMVRVHPATR